MMDYGAAELDWLRRERTKTVNSLNAAKKRLQDEEKTYNSMQEFSGVANTTCSNFSSLNSSKTGALADAKSVQKNCLTAKEYCKGMEKVFSKIGGKIVGGLLADLSSLTSGRLKDHAGAINDLEKTIEVLKRRIEEIDRRITELEESMNGGDVS